jgi:tRNA nucleotidyltransferase/poly(A) polymerase
MTPREFAISVVQRLQSAGFQALWAGGCVRDQLMGNQPKDYDVATNAKPEEVRQLFGFRKTLPIGAAFGVISVIGSKSSGQIEVATFRRDAQYSDGRHPDSVEYSSAQEDAQRRDFTINGMFFDPLKNEVIDYVGGQDDLQRRLIRAIGNPHDRIQEDKLRMLRGVRFASTFGFELETNTLQAIQSAANQIGQISAERIGNELVRMLSHPTRSEACRLLLESNLLAQVLPVGWFQRQDWLGTALERRLLELHRLTMNEFAPAAFLMLRCCFERIPDSFDSTSAKPLNNPRENPLDTTAALHPATGIGLVALQERWRLTNQQVDQIAWIARHWKLLGNADLLPWSKLQPLLIHPSARLGIATAEAVLGSTLGLQHCDSCLRLPPAQLDPPWLIDGRDLIRLGLKPGPQFKRLLQDIRDRQLDGELSTIEQAQMLLKSVTRLSD